MAPTSPTESSASSHGTWTIDEPASLVEFAIEERLAFVKRRTVIGRYAGISGTIAFDEARPTEARIEIVIDAASIDTGDPRRDRNLRGAQFFDTARFPVITFTSRRCDTTDAAIGRHRAVGDLTVRDVTRAVELDVACVPSGSVVRISATTVLNRRDFGRTWGNPLYWIAEEVRVSAVIEASPATAFVRAA